MTKKAPDILKDQSFVDPDAGEYMSGIGSELITDGLTAGWAEMQKARDNGLLTEDIGYAYVDPASGEVTMAIFDGASDDGKGGGRRAALAARQALHELTTGGESEDTIPTDKLDRLRRTFDTIARRVDQQAEGGYTTGLVGLIEDLPGGLTFHWGSVGDSPLFLFRGGELTQLNREETERQDLLDAGEDEEEADKRGQIITNALGAGFFHGLGQLGSVELEEGDFLLIASDGLTGDKKSQRMKGGDNSEAIKYALTRPGLSPAEKAQLLLALATKIDDRYAKVIEIGAPVKLIPGFLGHNDDDTWDVDDSLPPRPLAPRRLGGVALDPEVKPTVESGANAIEPGDEGAIANDEQQLQADDFVGVSGTITDQVSGATVESEQVSLDLRDLFGDPGTLVDALRDRKIESGMREKINSLIGSFKQIKSIEAVSAIWSDLGPIVEDHTEQLESVDLYIGNAAQAMGEAEVMLRDMDGAIASGRGEYVGKVVEATGVVQRLDNINNLIIQLVQSGGLRALSSEVRIEGEEADFYIRQIEQGDRFRLSLEEARWMIEEYGAGIVDNGSLDRVCEDIRVQADRANEGHPLWRSQRQVIQTVAEFSERGDRVLSDQLVAIVDDLSRVRLSLLHKSYDGQLIRSILSGGLLNHVREQIGIVGRLTDSVKTYRADAAKAS